MKRIKYIGILGLAAAVFSLSSCDKDNKQVTFDNADGVSFVIGSGSKILPPEGGTVPVEVYRGRTDMAADIPVRLADESGLFSVSPAKFAAGEGQTTVTVTPSGITSGKKYAITLSFPEENSTPGCVSSYKLTVEKEYLYEDFDIGYIESEAFEDTWPVLIQKADAAIWYKCKDLYENGLDIIVKVDEEEGEATVEEQAAWSHASYGTVYVSGKGKCSDGVITVTLKHYCDVGSFGEFEETIHLHDGSQFLE